jgi:hypothetical protein
MVVDDRRGCCRCGAGTERSVRRGGRTLSDAVSRHADGWYCGNVLTLVMGAKVDRLAGSTIDAGANCLVLELHSSESHPLEAEWSVNKLEFDAWEAESEKIEEVEEEADEEREGAYG